MNKKEKALLLFINFTFLMGLILVVGPLLWNSQYNVPSADDWSYGVNAYQAIQNGAGFFQVLLISIKTMAHSYLSWEGRFANSLLASLQPGIWGEEYYCLVAWIMLGGLIIGEMIFFRLLLGNTDKESKYLWIPIVVPSLMLQILYTPSTVESFYWYTGAVNYTFIFALTMIFAVLFWKLGTNQYLGKKKIWVTIIALVLIILIGGDNYSTSLASFSGILAFYFWMFVFVRKKNRELVKHAFLNTWILTITLVACMLICILAPGNLARLNGNFGGGTSNGAVWAIAFSLVRTGTNIYSWMNLRVFFFMLLILPFVWKAVSKMNASFEMPAVFTLLTFCVYASEITANLMVDGTTGGGRTAAVLYDSFHVWIILNEVYWLGWLSKKDRVAGKVHLSLTNGYLFLHCAIVGMILVGLMAARDLKELSSYRAYRDYKQGWAEQYKKEWDARFEVLHDSETEKVEFTPLSTHPNTIMYTDLQDEEGYTWVNRDCASYYGKEYIHIIETEK